MRKLWVVAKDAYLQTVKSLSFVILLLLPIIIGAVIAVISFFAAASAMNTNRDVALIGESAHYEEIQKIIGDNWKLNTEITTQEEAEKSLREDDISGYYQINESDGNLQIRFINRNDSPDMSQTKIQSELHDLERRESAKSLGLTEEEIAQIDKSDWNIETVTKTYGPEGEESTVDLSRKYIGLGIAYVVVFGMFMFITNYASIIATNIAQEKGTHIMEILLSCSSPMTQFFGKILGVSLAIFTQIAIYSIVGVITILTFPFDNLPLPEGVAIPSLGGFTGLIIPAVFMFIIGCFTYIVLAAMFGSFVSKAEDAQKAMTPMMIPLIAGFYIGMFSLNSPQALFVKVTSFIPFFTPFIMPFRIAGGTASQVEVWLSILGMVLFAVLVLFLSMKIYKKSVLDYDDSSLFAKVRRALWG